jgi:hypothetical protein
LREEIILNALDEASKKISVVRLFLFLGAIRSSRLVAMQTTPPNKNNLET